MALFTDGIISTIEDLRGYESSILNVARTEGIDLPVKLELAQQELEVQLASALSQWGNVDRSRVRGDLSNVAVTLPLRQWHIFHSLALAYRDAYGSQLNDRYAAKWKEYDQLAKWSSRLLMDSGIGLVDDPVAKAQPPELSTSPGSGQPGTRYVRVAWLNSMGQEGCASDPVAMTVGEGSLLTARPVNAPANAAGWNVYTGEREEDTRRQNETMLAVGAIWTETREGPKDGPPPPKGQEPSQYIRIERILQRG